MDTGILCVANGLVTGVDGLGMGVGQSCNDLALHLPGDPAHRLEVARRAVGESRLYNIHTQLVQLVGYLYLFIYVQGSAGRLLSIPERGIEYHYFFHLEPPNVPVW